MTTLQGPRSEGPRHLLKGTKFPNQQHGAPLQTPCQTARRKRRETSGPRPPGASKDLGGGAKKPSRPPQKDKLNAVDFEVKNPRSLRDSSGFDKLLFGKVNAGQLSVFARQLAAYQEAGVDLAKSLKGLANQFGATVLGGSIRKVEQAIRQGDSLADAFERQDRVFDRFFLKMMRVAEARGSLPEILRELSVYYEAKQRLLRQAKSALIYPVCVLVIAAGVSALIVFGILPIFIPVIEDIGRGKPLPLPTRLLMSLGYFARDMGWWVVPTAIVGLIIGLPMLYRSEKGRMLIDELVMRVPILACSRRKSTYPDSRVPSGCCTGVGFRSTRRWRFRRTSCTWSLCGPRLRARGCR